MKIIGSAGEQRWIFEASSDEMAQLCGFASRYSQGFDGKFGVGATFYMGTIYNEATTVLSTHRNAMDSAKMLRKTADKFLAFFDVEEGKK